MQLICYLTNYTINQSPRCYRNSFNQERGSDEATVYLCVTNFANFCFQVFRRYRVRTDLLWNKLWKRYFPQEIFTETYFLDISQGVNLIVRGWCPVDNVGTHNCKWNGTNKLIEFQHNHRLSYTSRNKFCQFLFSSLLKI